MSGETIPSPSDSSSEDSHDSSSAGQSSSEDQGDLSEDAAIDFVKQLKADKRYLRDVY
jgi:hypothetical protein